MLPTPELLDCGAMGIRVGYVLYPPYEGLTELLQELRAPMEPRTRRNEIRICPRCKIARLPKHKQLCVVCRMQARKEAQRQYLGNRARRNERIKP